MKLVLDVLRNSAFVLSDGIDIISPAPELSVPELILKFAELLI